jgi:hypothetical protein
MTKITRPQPPPQDSDAMAALSLIISGVLLWGAIGWALGRWLDVPVLAGLGLVVGGGLGVLAVYIRYGRAQSGPPTTAGPVAVPAANTTDIATLREGPLGTREDQP